MENNEVVKNKPYVKKFDEQGKLINPISRAYLNASPSNRGNRKKQYVVLINHSGHKYICA